MASEGRGWRRLGLLLAAAALLATVYGRALGYPLARDDVGHFERSERWERPPSALLDHFREEFWARASRSGLYRPLAAATIQATQWAAGLRPAALRAGNLAILLAAAVALAALASRLGVSRGAAALVALALAAHPLLSETVLEVVSRAETQALLCVALAGIAIESGVAALAGVAFLGALLSKEGAFAALPALLLLGWQRAARGGPARAGSLAAAALIGALALALALRASVFGDLVGLDREGIPRLDNPLAGEPFATRLLTGVAVLGRYVEILAWPLRLAADRSFAAIPPLRSLADGHLALGAVALAGGALWLALALRGGAVRRAESFGLLLAGSSWLLVSSIAAPIGTIMAERLFTLPAAGLLLATGAALDRATAGSSRPATTATVESSRRRAIAAAAVVVILALAARTGLRAGDWRDGETLWRSALRVAPESARVQCAVGFALVEKGDDAAAKPCFERALEILPDYGKAHQSLGALLGREGALGPGAVHLWLAARSPGAAPDELARFEALWSGFGDDFSIRYAFMSYGRELAQEHRGDPIHDALAEEIARMGGQ